jgi:hypothetical protein
MRLVFRNNKGKIKNGQKISIDTTSEKMYRWPISWSVAQVVSLIRKLEA